ncbi:HNH endonuclease family protein [Phaeobacter sp. CAU 1743]|uniref:HNH endonuclease family protein n=1 Tax=Phaeobacter sp. CAU 1743 TaxID=3140367 RepID=UPI00325BA890
MIRGFWAFCFLLLTFEVYASEVKLSVSGICHDEHSAWYQRTKNFTAFDDMESCLSSGRPYSGYEAKSSYHNLKKTTEVEAQNQEYDRALYGRWDDLDADCQNTRHELLAELSTIEVLWDDRGCTVRRGRWIDPYTDEVFMEARDLDVDHLVPLAYAHERGASAWTSEKRTEFANDPRNLFAVDASVNRSKGSRGPSHWLPPNEDFRCQYIVRFVRIMIIYELQFQPVEAAEIKQLREANC